MKQLIVLLFSVLLLSSFLASARILVPSKQGDMEVKVTDNALAHSSSDIKDFTAELMGSEKCNEKDEECSIRRMTSEAHLDYFYTQHYPPPAMTMN